ncbi:MAG: thermonuclease family protein [Stappiaceae bacterium]
MDNEQEAEIVAITDFLDLKLKQGTLVHLADIDFPGGRKAARQYLANNLLGKTVTLRGASDKTDRWRRKSAHVVVQASGDWLQSDLIELGLARVRPQMASKNCLDSLFQNEKRARRANKGIWQSDHFRRIAVEHAGSDRYVHNQYAVFVGKIVSVGETERWRYLNFGRNWKTDFTVRINRRSKNVIGTIEKEADMVPGNVVEVRGIVRNHDGGEVDVHHPAQLQILKRREATW